MPFIDCYSNDQSPIVRTKPLINPNISSTKSFEQINRYNNIYTCDPNVFSFTNDNNNELDIVGLSSRNKIMYYPIHDKQSIVEDSADTSQPSSAITHPIHSLTNNSKPCKLLPFILVFLVFSSLINCFYEVGFSFNDSLVAGSP